MYVCVCRAVTDNQIFQAARKGAKNLKDLKRDLGVASECGLCASCARQCLKDAHAENMSANDSFIAIAVA